MHILYGTLIEKWLLPFKWDDNQLDVVCRCGDIDIGLFGVFCAWFKTKRHDLGISGSLRGMHCLNHQYKSGYFGLNEMLTNLIWYVVHEI